MSANGKILVAIDGSPAARAATRVAVQIAQARSLAIDGLFIIDERLLLNPYADFQHELGNISDVISRDRMLAALKVRGGEALFWLEEQCRAADVPVQTELLLGGVTELILHEAEQAEMISLGRQGGNRDHPSDRLGHNFRYIVHHVHRPVIAGGDRRYSPMKRLLLAYDSHEHMQCAVEWAAMLHQALPGDLMVLAMQNQDERPPHWEAAIKACLDHGGLQDYNLVIRTGVTASAITMVSSTHHADLIVLPRYPHNAFIEWLTGSTVDTILRNSPLPVLIV